MAEITPQRGSVGEMLTNSVAMSNTGIIPGHIPVTRRGERPRPNTHEEEAMVFAALLVEAGLAVAVASALTTYARRHFAPRAAGDAAEVTE
ncbi:MULTISPECIES: hypothetical protein [Amycolatopsis]|uniref:Uncharacterized protein n=1 Tax=Amycolatopsis thermalba TaxID=944492 RepID=A0ABY4NPQ8_9PSEU|nr:MULTISPECIES: hypothetical protein [Amycolatopsis]UQS21407.1 hypothetical protein L1857_00465 [Amycolatopsis thermalba]